MRTRSRVATGDGFSSVATVGGLLLGGTLLVGIVATTAALVVTDPLAPGAHADALQRFDSCPSLLHWYVDHAVKEVGPYGWIGPAVYGAVDDMAGSMVPQAAGSAPMAAEKSTDARASSGTGTNTQEADVDEPDVAKTDGRRVVRLVDQRTVVITDTRGAAPRELGRISLPVDDYGGELLLAGDHVLVSETTGQWGGGLMVMEGPAQDGVGRRPVVMRPPGTRIVDIDISDAAHPRIVHDDTYTGQQVSMRLYGDTVRLVTSTGRPELPWAIPGQPGSRQLSEAEALRHNQALVSATTIQDWLPGVVDNRTGGGRTPLVDCADVYHPARWSGAATTAVTTYRVGTPADRTAVAVTADGEVVYSSANRLYVTSTEAPELPPWRGTPGPVRGGLPRAVPDSARITVAPDTGMMPVRPTAVTTEVHAFALDGTSTRYVGSGHVDGSVRDRWSMDEHGGKLRVAWTQQGSQMIKDSNGEVRLATRNGLTVFSERDGALVPTGRLDGLGVDENIQSVRWFDDFAVLVTFRQMDPLYTIDLRDQDHPAVLGALKIPGYSGYLHPIGANQLLGLGVEATPEGRRLGTKAAVFDIADLTDVRTLSSQGFGAQSDLPALADPRSFTWLPDRRTGLTTVSSWSGDRSRLVALKVRANGALEAYDLATDVAGNARTLPLADGRVALVDDQGVRVLDVG